MKLLADENMDASVIAGLRKAGHEVIAISEMEPGVPDETVLARANSEAALLVTEDTDFGELAFRLRLVHHGVLLVRLAGLPAPTKTSMLLRIIDVHEASLVGNFSVISPGTVRIRRTV